ncbi:AraC family transcriptional regulator [Chitinophaga polysaccharea]|uniref:AraC family transcriptional regulator n=1 Tax=Chitinophaga polysaccharea TaxID=1293035 RepID=A0A561PC57_9BACT|nr:AraC family transcriptional regulator [Chitinophaga polysaccharea]TWF35688.1 AraC family transcriptional regulator [Chitinophaga polysaccharea]
MKYLYENFTFPADQSFTIRREVLEMKEYNTFKSHVNFEIALLDNCQGKRFIGDHIADFDGPELVLLGSYLPHCWQYQGLQDYTQPPRAYVVHFFPNFMDSVIMGNPEAKELNILFGRAARGVLFSGDTIIQARFILEQMLGAKGLRKIAWMIELLDLLAHSKDGTMLSSPYFNILRTSTQEQRITQVFDYVYKNFKENITLGDAAAIIHMSTSGFCRYFKQKTNKTFIEILKELRIGHAAKLLLAGTHSISTACYESGYNNLSNFNKHFKEVEGLSPSNFLKQYRIRH